MTAVKAIAVTIFLMLGLHVANVGAMDRGINDLSAIPAAPDQTHWRADVIVAFA